MGDDSSTTVKCGICKERLEAREMMPAAWIRDSLSELIRREHPEWTADSYICLDDLDAYRHRFVQQTLETDRGELSALEKEVAESLRNQEIISENLNEEFDQKQTVGERIADRVAEFGGSWRFIILFGVILFLWITFNSTLLLRHPYDPYPFILLNLILSCVAALQAPVIMMSQNRQEAKDRLRAEHDYRVNLKAELEIRNLNMKMDQLLAHQWQRLLEIQQIQMEMMQEAIQSSKQPRANAAPEEKS